MVDLYARTAPYLYAQIHRILRDDGLTGTALQEVYQNVWRSRHSWAERASRESPMTMLRALAHRTALDRLYAMPRAERPRPAPNLELKDATTAYLDCPQIEPDPALRHGLIERIKADLRQRKSPQ